MPEQTLLKIEKETLSDQTTLLTAPPPFLEEIQLAKADLQNNHIFVDFLQKASIIEIT
jgi:hypothetical protein